MTDIAARATGAEIGSASIEQFGYRQELKRSLSLFDLVASGPIFIVSTASISYVLVNVATAAKIAGIAWLMVGIVALVGLKLGGRQATLPA